MRDELKRIEARAEDLVEVHTDMLEHLIGLRKKHELTQKTVAERMGVSQPTVASFEHYDTNPTLATVRRYALAVGARIQITVKDDCADESAEKFETIIAPMKQSMGTLRFSTGAPSTASQRWKPIGTAATSGVAYAR